MLVWESLPPLPGELGVAGPYAGVHNDALIIAGGANFPRPVWENEKAWQDRIDVMTKVGETHVWKHAGALPAPVAYGAAVSTSDGVICMGGNHENRTLDRVLLLQWDSLTESVSHVDYPVLPKPCAYGAATLIHEVIYLAGGQSGTSLATAMNNFWSLDLSRSESPAEFRWTELPPWPGPPRALNLTVHQHDGFEDCVYVMSGRRQRGSATTDVEFLRDVWKYTPSARQWKRQRDVPRCVMAGTSIGVGQSHVLVLGGADGSLFNRADELKDTHPGFPPEALAFHTITDTWTSAGVTPQNHVTTIAVPWDDAIVIPSGEVRPRVRSPQIWRITPNVVVREFGLINYAVLFAYLASMVVVGIFFARRHRNTDDFFRGGQHIPWWAAGCSIFATMLSSLTFTGIPSKAYAQDWVYAVGNFMIPLVAVFAVFVFMPFFRRIDATSAYEYLERRFSRPVRWFGTLSFTLFHLFRMAVVMSLTAMAISVATPLTATQSVLLMGVLSILYCASGGIEAVIWTDTLQTAVLMGGAMLALCLLISRTDGGLGGFLSAANANDKLVMANLHWDMTSSRIGLWVIMAGALGQNLSSYTADQAVVQRYMTTSDQRRAARSIWTNAVLSIPATLLFFAIGTGLYAFYRTHPEKLDPTITTDQIFPLFIAREMPIGIAGLIVAGIFAAAQSTVSTSMNSTATAIVTDFMRPLGACRTEKGYLLAARLWTVLMGLSGMCLGLVFIDPSIKSLFDSFIKVIGLFMGVLGGLFILGAFTCRANASGALAGASCGAAFMFYLWRFTDVNGYLYTASGIATCLAIGYLTSMALPGTKVDLSGLTIHTLNQSSLLQVPANEESS
ncbi:MAG: sodium/solute symporter [Planctomycetota bacterium]